MVKPINMTVKERWDALRQVQDAYPHFPEFLYDIVTGLMGFECTRNQLDMALYLESGPLFRMIQAQRGQAKTTVTAAYAVWRQIHNPSTRVLIISSGDTMAQEISNWVIQILTGMPELECMLPDRSRGDRASVEKYDIHRDLKGPEKSPSIACVGITSNLQGKRADVLIADDIESAKNSATDVQRERIAHLSRDFTSICTKGDIIYLGTPQSIDSIYNGLPGRGFTIRIWPGRFPTEKELENYGAWLAPSILQAILADPSLQTGGGLLGNRGKPTDDVILPEDILTAKEIDQGAAYFQLQHMLDTRLADSERYPLKVEKLIFTSLLGNSAPMAFQRSATEASRIRMPSDFPVTAKFYMATHDHSEFGAYEGTHMYVDPAGGGQNGDETAYAVSQMLAGKVYIRAVGGVKGGLDEPQMDELTEVAEKWKPNVIHVEENYGKGALSHTWQPRLRKKHVCEVVDVWETGQKELRIIDTLEPLIGAGKLVFDEELIMFDWQSVRKYPTEKQSSFMLFHQISRITRDKGALFHEDRLDALAGTCRYWLENLAVDEKDAAIAAQRLRYKQMMSDPLGNGRPIKSLDPAHNARLGKLKRRF